MMISTIADKRGKLYEFGQNALTVSGTYAWENTGMQVVFKDRRIKLLNRFAHGTRLLQKSQALLIIVDHVANTTKVICNHDELFETILFPCLHTSSPSLLPHKEIHQVYPEKNRLCKERESGDEK